jgi:N,N'-diacetyllegionaminate synthase
MGQKEPETTSLAQWSAPGPVLLAEIGQAHDGSVGIAHGMLDSIAGSGFDGVKFQVHDPDAESTYNEPIRAGSKILDASRIDYWRRTSFVPDQWSDLVDHAHQLGLLVVASTFSRKSIDLLSEIGIDGWKIGSGEVL